MRADQSTPIKLYRSLLRSKHDYASFIYGATRKPCTKILDTTYHQGFRLVLGAFRTSLYTEADETPPHQWHIKLVLQYHAKIISCLTNSIPETTYPNPHDESHHAENVLKPFGLRMKPITEELSSTLPNIQETMVSIIPPWTTKHFEIILEMHNFPKKKPHPLTFMDTFQEILVKIPWLHKNLYRWIKNLGQNRLCSSKQNIYQIEISPNGKFNFHCRDIWNCVCTWYNFWEQT